MDPMPTDVDRELEAAMSTILEAIDALLEAAVRLLAALEALKDGGHEHRSRQPERPR